MRKLVLGLALASTAIATPALARDKSWYLELDFGGMIVEDADLKVDGVSNAATADFKTGFDGGAVLGYDFGPFRLETEASYRQAPVKSFGGDASNLSFMVNGLLDFGPDDGLQGFVGGGAGVARVDADFIDDSDTGFAWQAIAGVRAPISSHWDVGLKYRFMNVANVDLVDVDGSSVSTRWRSHSLMGTLAYNFGEPAAPPPPRRRPAAPPPPRRRLRRRLWNATRVRTSCSSTGISRTSRRKPPPFSTARSVPMATATAFRSCWPVTPTVRVPKVQPRPVGSS